MIHVYLSVVTGVILKEQFSHFYVTEGSLQQASIFSYSSSLGNSYNVHEEKWRSPSDVTKIPSYLITALFPQISFSFNRLIRIH